MNARDKDGQPLSDGHVLGSLRLLLIAGIDTTWSAIGSSLWHLAKTPADRERLVAEPELMPTAVEELLRAYSPVTMAREVMKETVISGCPVKPGNMVLLSFPAANRDPAMFPDADKVVIDRKENRHAAFGLGIHRCVGSNLARMEMTVAIEEWLKRIPDFRLDPAGQVTWSEGTVRGPRQLPVLFGKATLNVLPPRLNRLVPGEPDVTDQAVNAGADDHLDIADVERRIKAIFIGSVGNLVEWYDFYAYTAFALYFAPAFFPNSDPVVQQLNAAVLFAATFLMRPLGGWLFGYIADRYGRRMSLTLSVVCMCFGSLIIAVTPTYATIGFAAPAILALARIIEGLSLGGEYGASATYLSEVADPKHRGFYSSFQYVTLIGGQLTAIIVLLLLQKVFLTPEELKDWGWRIPVRDRRPARDLRRGDAAQPA